MRTDQKKTHSGTCRTILHNDLAPRDKFGAHQRAADALIAFLIAVETGIRLPGPRSETVYRFDKELCHRLFGEVDAVFALYEGHF